MIFVEDNEVPVGRMDPLVLRLDAAGSIRTEEVLEGSEAYDRPVLVEVFGADPVPRRGITGIELPAFEVYMRHQVRFP